MVIPDVDGYTKKPKPPENNPKNANKQHLIENQNNTKTKIQAKWGPSFYI